MQVIQAESLPKYRDIPAVVIGNGPSRLRFDLSALAGRAIIFGCNRLFKDYDFSGFPHFFGACDTEIFQAAIGKNLPLVVPRSNELLLSYEVSHVIYPSFLEWKVTGQAMLNLAKFLLCNPIYYLGFGEIGNVYYQDKSVQRMEKFQSYIEPLIQESLYRKVITLNEWDSLIDSCPVKYRQKVTRIDGLPTPYGIESS